MKKKAYKYAAPRVLDRMFSGGECTFKCSFPKDFNDPYELFLTIDYNQPPEALAFYYETIGEMPQLPTTCLSNAPDVVPMWAHYAQNREGFVVEIDEAVVSRSIKGVAFEDVDYRDGPDPNLLSMLGQAYVTCKPRHVLFLQRAVFSAAYYTKMSCWSYERERRLVADLEDVKTLDGAMLLPLPSKAITTLIVGDRASAEVKDKLRTISKAFKCPLYELKVGRTTSKPYVVDEDGKPHAFDGDAISKVRHLCAQCKAPLMEKAKLCPWCAIETHHEKNAAERNPMRILAHFDMLDDYYARAERIRQRLEK